MAVINLTTHNDKRVALNALRAYRDSLEKRITHTRTRMLNAEETQFSTLRQDEKDFRLELDVVKRLITDVI